MNEESNGHNVLELKDLPYNGKVCKACAKPFYIDPNLIRNAAYKEDGFCSYECAVTSKEIKQVDVAPQEPKSAEIEPGVITEAVRERAIRIPQWPGAKKQKPFTRPKCIDISNWAKIREPILARDNYCCRICGDNGADSKLNVHHINWNRLNNKSTNLVTLCSKCHRAVHREGYKPELYEDWPPPWGYIE